MHIFPNANANEQIAEIERRFAGRALDSLTLREISEKTSPDFATTFFYSKGGPETALALGKILEPGETTSVKAWLSVGGLMRGTLLADRIMTWPRSWIARIIFSHEKIDFRSLPGLTTTASRLRMNGIKLPCHILVVQSHWQLPISLLKN
jgi:hypothetical protein